MATSVSGGARRLGVVVAMTVASLSFAQQRAAAQTTWFFSVDEWGKGYVCAGAGPTRAGIPGCHIDVQTQTADFLRMRSGFTTDATPTLPTAPPGGQAVARVLTYRLPFSIGLFEEAVFDVPEGKIGDYIRFNGDLLYFYSLQEAQGTGDCSLLGTPGQPPTGCDGLADKPNVPGSAGFPAPQPGSVLCNPACPIHGEDGPEGNNSYFRVFVANGDVFEFNFQSDELPSIAPPCTVQDPRLCQRDITGFDAPDLIVRGPAGPFITPEPGTLGLVGTGLMLFAGCGAANRKRRRPDVMGAQ